MEKLFLRAICWRILKSPSEVSLKSNDDFHHRIIELAEASLALDWVIYSM